MMTFMENANIKVHNMGLPLANAGENHADMNLQYSFVSRNLIY